MRGLCGLVVTLAFVAPSVTSAAPVLVNGSFELGPPMGGNQDVDVLAGSLDISGWTVFGHSIDYLGPPWDVSDGLHGVDLDGRNATFSGVEQAFPTDGGLEYAVSFDLSGNPQGGTTVKNVRVSVDGFSQDYSFDTTGQSTSALNWLPIAFSFTATGPNATLTFMSLSATPSSYGPLLDNVVVLPLPEPVVVSEPASLFLFAAGFALTTARRRFKRPE